MHRLLVMRHATAVAAEIGQADRDRALDRRGRLEAALMGAHLAELMAAGDWRLDAAVLSPSRRTRETYAAMRPLIDDSPEPALSDTLYTGGGEAILAALGTVPATAATALLIGHNPTLETLIAGLDPRAPRRLPPAGLAAIGLTAGWAGLASGAAVLTSFETPRSLV